MKIAVAAMGNTVAGHFGHCENFIFFDTADGAITAVNSVPNPGHRPGFLPNFLADNGAQVIISGGMGGGAVDIFNERGVEVIVGVQGDATAAAGNEISCVNIINALRMNRCDVIFSEKRFFGIIQPLTWRRQNISERRITETADVDFNRMLE